MQKTWLPAPRFDGDKLRSNDVSLRALRLCVRPFAIRDSMLKIQNFPVKTVKLGASNIFLSLRRNFFRM